MKTRTRVSLLNLLAVVCIFGNIFLVTASGVTGTLLIGNWLERWGREVDEDDRPGRERWFWTWFVVGQLGAIVVFTYGTGWQAARRREIAQASHRLLKREIEAREEHLLEIMREGRKEGRKEGEERRTSRW